MSEVVQYVEIALQGCAERYVEKQANLALAHRDLEKQRLAVKEAETALEESKVELALQALRFYGGRLNIIIPKGACAGGILRIDMTPGSLASKREPKDAIIVVEKVVGSLR